MVRRFDTVRGKYVEPIPEHVKIYDAYYHTYRELYAALKDSFANQAKILEELNG